MAAIPSILFGAALTILTALALGSAAFGISGLSPSTARVERYPMYFGLGAALLSNIVFVICVAQVAWPATFAAVSVCILAASWFLRPTVRSRNTHPGNRFPIVEWICGLIVATYLTAYFAYALAPEIMADAVAYHLGFVRLYLNHHGFLVVTDNIYAFIPQGMEMLFLYAYSFGAHSAAKLVHFATAAATVAAMIGFASRYSTARAGWVAAALYLCSPVVSLDASSAYNDCALAFFLFLALAAFMDWYEEPSSQGVALVGAFAGFCFAVKYTGAVALVAGGLAIVWASFRRGAPPRHIVRSAAIFSGAALLFVLPWVLKNLYVTGNPFSPLFNSLFPNPYVTPIWESVYTDGLRHFNGFGRDSITDYLTAPLEVTTWGNKLTSIIGPVYLLFPVVLLAWRSPLVRTLLLAAGVAGLPWFGNTGARFLIPMLPFAALAIAVSLERLPRFFPAAVGGAAAVAHAVLCWHSVIVVWHPQWLWRIESPIPWAGAFRQIPEREYLANRIIAYEIGRRIDSVAGRGDRVLSFEQLPEAYMDTQVVVCFQGAAPERMFRSFQLPMNQSLWPSSRLTVKTDGVAGVSGLRVATKNSVAGLEWALSEIQFFDGDVQLDPTAEWAVQVDSYPWGAHFLTDGDEASTWYGGESLKPGMRAEVLFPEPLDVSEVRLIFPHQQRPAELAFQVRTADGLWRSLDDEPILDELRLQKADLQHQAYLELLRNDIDFVLINTTGQGHNFVAPDVTADPAAWGLEEVLRQGTYILYKVQAPHDLGTRLPR